MNLPKKILTAALTLVFLISIISIVGLALPENRQINKAYAHSPIVSGLTELGNCLADNPDHTAKNIVTEGETYLICKHPEGSEVVPVPPTFSNVPNPLGDRFSTLGQIVAELLPYILVLGGMVATLFVIWGGLRYMTAQGDPKAITSARGTIVSAVIGLIIVISIFAILKIIELFFKIKVLGALAAPAYAAVDIGCEFKFGDQCASDAFENLGVLMTSIINLALAAGGLVFFLMLIWGGIRYMLSRGDDKQITEARQTLTNAVIGLLIIIASFGIIKLIELATGANISIF